MTKRSHIAGQSPIKTICSIFILLIVASCGGKSGEPRKPEQRELDEVIEIQGQVNLKDNEGGTYSVEGASARIIGINEAILLIRRGKGQSVVVLADGTVDSNGVLATKVLSDNIDNSDIYVIEVQCPPEKSLDCNLNNPLHIALTGEQLKTAHWEISALTEMAYQKAAYYIAAEFEAEEIQNFLDDIASSILPKTETGENRTYSDLIQWNSNQLYPYRNFKKEKQLEDFATELATGSLSNYQLQSMSLDLLSPFVSEAEVSVLPDHKVGDTYFKISQGEDTLYIRDYSNPTQSFLSKIDGASVVYNSEAYIEGVFADEKYAYLLADPSGSKEDNDLELQIYDLSDKKYPVLVGFEQLFMDDYTFYTEIVVDQNLAYISSKLPEHNPEEGIYSNTVAIVDIEDRNNPKLLKKFSLPHEYNSSDFNWRIIDGLFYSMVNGNGLQIFNFTTNPTAESPLLVGNVLFGTDSRSNRYYDFKEYNSHYIFAQYSSEIIELVDISHPSNPTVSKIDFPEPPLIKYGNHDDTRQATRNISYKDHYVFIVTEERGLFIYDYKNPKQPILMSSINTYAPYHAQSNLLIEGNTLFIANRIRGSSTKGIVEIIDIKDLSNPIWKNSFLIDYLNNGSLLKEGDFLYIQTDRGDKFKATAYDLSVVKDPLLNAKLEIPEIQLTSMSGLDKIILGGSEELYIVENSSSNNISLINSLRGFDGSISSLSQVDKYTYISDEAGLKIFDLSNPKQPLRIFDLPGEQFFSIETIGNFAYVTQKRSLSVLDISDPSSPQIYLDSGPYSSAELESLTPKLMKHGNFLIVIDGEHGLKSFDISKPGWIRQDPIDAEKEPIGISQDVDIKGDFAFVANNVQGLMVFDIRNPDNLDLRAKFPIENANLVKVVGDYAYVTNDLKGFYVINISDIYNMNLVGKAETLGNVTSMIAEDGVLKLGTEYGIEIFNLIPE